MFQDIGNLVARAQQAQVGEIRPGPGERLGVKLEFLHAGAGDLHGLAVEPVLRVERCARERHVGQRGLGEGFARMIIGHRFQRARHHRGGGSGVQLAGKRGEIVAWRGGLRVAREQHVTSRGGGEKEQVHRMLPRLHAVEREGRRVTVVKVHQQLARRWGKIQRHAELGLRRRALEGDAVNRACADGAFAGDVAAHLADGDGDAAHEQLVLRLEAEFGQRHVAAIEGDGEHGLAGKLVAPGDHGADGHQGRRSRADRGWQEAGPGEGNPAGAKIIQRHPHEGGGAARQRQAQLLRAELTEHRHGRSDRFPRLAIG